MRKWKKDLASEFMKFPGGALCMFGAWFGRPMDNVHTPGWATYEDKVLKVGFNEGELLEIGDPSAIEIDGNVLTIAKASWIKWSWYYYGRPKTEENHLYYKYEVCSGTVKAITNSPWPTQPNIENVALQIC